MNDTTKTTKTQKKYPINPHIILDDTDYKFMIEMIGLYETFRKTSNPFEIHERKKFENFLSKLTFLFDKEVTYNGKED